MNPYEYLIQSGLAPAGIGFYSVGTRFIVQLPATSFRWSFYTSPITELGGPTGALANYLESSRIQFNELAPYDIAPGSIQGVKGTIQVSNFNHAQAVAAEVARIQDAYGSSINGDVATNGGALRMSNLNGNGRILDVLYQSRNFWTGATNNFIEVKTGLTDLTGTTGGTAGVQAPADAANLSNFNAKVAGIRYLGQGLRIFGAAGAAYDLYSTGATLQSQFAAGDNLGAARTGVQFSGRWAAAAYFAGQGALWGSSLGPWGTLGGGLAGGVFGGLGGNFVSGWAFDQAVGAAGGGSFNNYNSGSLIPPPAAPTGGDSSSQGSAPIDTSQTWGSLQELDPMTGQPVGQPVNWGSTTAPAYQEMDGNGTKGGIGLPQQQSLSATSEQLNYAAEPAQQTSGALGAINTAFGSGSGFAPADQLAPANAPVFDSGLYSALGNAVDTIGSAFNSAEIASAEAVSGVAGVLDSFASTLGGFFNGGGGTPGFGGGGTPGFSGGGTFGGFFGPGRARSFGQGH